MFLNQGSVQLSLLIGPVPVAAPREVVESLVHAKVENGSGDAQSGFELTFELPARSPLRTLFLLTGGGSVPLMRVVLVVTINGRAESIIDGVTTHVETQPGQGGVAKLVVKGKDMSALMDIIELPGIPFPALPPSARVLLCLAKYAALGVIPLVIPSILDIPPLPIAQIPQPCPLGQRHGQLLHTGRLAHRSEEPDGHLHACQPNRAPEPQPATLTRRSRAA